MGSNPICATKQKGINMIKLTEKEIDELEKRIEKLKEEKKKLIDLSPEKRVAECLHKRLCVHNHTDGCGWFYENWDDFGTGYSKKRYFSMAKNLLEHFTEEQIELFIELIPR